MMRVAIDLILVYFDIILPFTYHCFSSHFLCLLPILTFCPLSEGNYIINYLATRGPDLEPFVVGSLIQLFCRVTKFGWLDDDRFREAVNELINFLSQVTWLLHIDLLVTDIFWVPSFDLLILFSLNSVH